ncbi:hypothetical protein EGT29_11755 [Pigmentiphaga sp. H8]|uniref:hypothetical protein n=1 Tax=Pigmentiphaga sp. H8 TaxID=2488560 RepID=UPI000F59E033|nr:hypothetical protein [Pigmentiphaga sp. H8]AZG08475.1 hypothetical protein EGT29_11755 [Pigmentiphaga sp. H8]
MQTRFFQNRFLVGLFLIATCSIVKGQVQVSCDDAVQAKAYAAGFDGMIRNEGGNGKARENEWKNKYEEAKERIIAAGFWTEQEANTFILTVAKDTPEGRELETKRTKASEEFRTLAAALDVLPVAAGGNKQAEYRGVCIFGKKAFEQLKIINEASVAAWQLVYRQVEAFGKKKGVSGF